MNKMNKHFIKIRKISQNHCRLSREDFLNVFRALLDMFDPKARNMSIGLHFHSYDKFENISENF